MQTSTAQTVAFIKARRALNLTSRRRRLPKQIPPDTIKREYAGALIAALAPIRPAFDELLHELPGLVASAARDVRHDADEARRIRDLIDKARVKMQAMIHPTALEDLARKYAGRVSAYQKAQLDRQVRAALGVDIFHNDQRVRFHAENFVANNVSLIKNIPESVAVNVEQTVLRGVGGGKLHGTIAEELQAKFGYPEERAKLIARDQVGKLYGQINSTRQREMGIKGFIWRASGDPRVREQHADWEGLFFSYDNLPIDEQFGPVIPGEAINCRCNAEPDFTGILDAADDDVDG